MSAVARCSSGVRRVLAPRSSLVARAFSASSGSHPDFAPRVKAPAAAAQGAGAPAASPTASRVAALVASKPVVLFMKGTPAQPQCGFSAQVVRILHQHGVDIHGEDVLRDADLRSTMKEFSKWPTFPQLYVGGEFVGGCDIVTTMHQGGELKDLLAKVPRPTLA